MQLQQFLVGGYPVDAYNNFIDGKRILGDLKTLRGLFSGLIAGIIASIFL